MAANGAACTISYFGPESEARERLLARFTGAVLGQHVHSASPAHRAPAALRPRADEWAALRVLRSDGDSRGLAALVRLNEGLEELDLSHKAIGHQALPPHIVCNQTQATDRRAPTTGRSRATRDRVHPARQRARSRLAGYGVWVDGRGWCANRERTV